MKQLSEDVCRVRTCFGYLHLSDKSREVIKTLPYSLILAIAGAINGTSLEKLLGIRP